MPERDLHVQKKRTFQGIRGPINRQSMRCGFTAFTYPLVEHAKINFDHHSRSGLTTRSPSEIPGTAGVPRQADRSRGSTSLASSNATA